MRPFPLQPGPKVQPAQLREGPRSCVPKKARTLSGEELTTGVKG